MWRLDYSGADGCSLCAFSTHPMDAGKTGDRPVLVLMHGGGPDHRSLVPLASLLCAGAVVILPDVRGYGTSVCRDPKCHKWSQYADDVASLLDHLDVPVAMVGGAGLGATISLTFAVAHPARVSGLILISVEDIEDDAGKAAEVEFMRAFAERVRSHGVWAGWEPILPDLSPIVGTMVREAMLDADPASLAAAAAIGCDRAFKSVGELLSLDVPALLFAGADWRHPAGLAKNLAQALKHGRLGRASMTEDLRTTEDFARAFAPEIAAFVHELWAGAR
jgi:3-oxoadipate enol-lactonase